MMKAKNASMMKLLPVLLGVVVIAIMSDMYIGYMADYDKREFVDSISREYILKMESRGYMSRQDVIEIVNKLQEKGFVSVNLAGSTTVPAGYGEQITLCIDAIFNGKQFLIGDFLNVEVVPQKREVKICKKTTAKY